MPRVTHVKKARKNYKEQGIKKGESYYWWKFRFGSKHMSKTAPKRQQLTQSNFYISLYDLEDRINDLIADDTLSSEVESIIEDIRQLAEEQEENKNNMPEGLQEGDTGQLLDERKDGLESWADELEGVDCSIDEDGIKDEVADEMGIEWKCGKPPEDEKEQFEQKVSEKSEEVYQEKIDEIQGCSHSL